MRRALPLIALILLACPPVAVAAGWQSSRSADRAQSSLTSARAQLAASRYITVPSISNQHVGVCAPIAVAHQRCAVRFVDASAFVSDTGEPMVAVYQGFVDARLRSGLVYCTFDPSSFAWERCG